LAADFPTAENRELRGVEAGFRIAARPTTSECQPRPEPGDHDEVVVGVERRVEEELETGSEAEESKYAPPVEELGVPASRSGLGVSKDQRPSSSDYRIHRFEDL
jgi:hypothetical protein